MSFSDSQTTSGTAARLRRSDRSTRLSSRPLKFLIAAVVALAAVLPSPPVSAEGSSSSSSIVGRGDILTTITISLPRVRRGGVHQSNPRCRTVVLSDSEIEFLIALVSLNPDEPRAREVGDLLRNHLASPDDPTPVDGNGNPAQQLEYDIRVRFCDGVARDIWATPRTVAASSPSTIIGRQMLTRLPAPRSEQTPPLGVPVPIHHPVFVSIPASLWRPVESTLAAGGITADVRALPVSMRVYSGDGSGRLVPCPGRGVPFDPSSRVSPARQSLNPMACTFTYLHPSRPDASTGATRDFIGSVTVLWSAEWRSSGGPWRSLGLIPRTQVFRREAREVRTAIVSGLAVRHSN